MRDAGGFLVMLLAPLFGWWLGRDKDDPYRTTMEDLHKYGRGWPRSGGDVEMANMFRFLSWLIAGIVPLVPYIAAAMSRDDASGRLGPVPIVIMNVSATRGVFGLGMALVSGFRWGWAQYLSRDLDRRLNPRHPGGGSAPLSLFLRSALPTNADLLFGVLFAILVAPLLYGETTVSG